jgi:hypothetical protein
MDTRIVLGLSAGVRATSVAVIALACIAAPVHGQTGNSRGFYGMNTAENAFPNTNLLVPDSERLVEPPVKIRTLISNLPMISGKTFAVRSLDEKKAWAWDYAGVAGQVASELTAHGMRTAAVGKSPDYVVWIDYAAAHTFVFDKFLIVLITDTSVTDMAKIHLKGKEGGASKHVFYEAVAATSKPRAEISDVLPALVVTFFQKFPDSRGNSRVVALAAK